MIKIKKHLLTTSIALLSLTSASTLATTYISAKALLDVKTGELEANPLIAIDEDVISQIQFNKQPTLTSNDELINLPELTVMPGLMDMHVHLTSDPTVSRSERIGQSVPRMAIKASYFAKKTLEAGFTTVRNLGAEGFSVIAVRDGINAGDIIGPRIWAAGPSLGITGGHCDNNRLPPEMKYTASGVADAHGLFALKYVKILNMALMQLNYVQLVGYFLKAQRWAYNNTHLKK